MAELNVTPLLDLAFVLLIIFIITTPLLENHVPIQLPSTNANPSQPIDPKSIRTVSIDRNGQIYLEEKQIDLRSLEQQLNAFRQATPDAAVVVRADKTLRLQQVMDVMVILQRAQITRMDLENSPQ